MREDVKALADQYALSMPDEYPYGFAVYMVEKTLEEVEDIESAA